MKNAMAGSQGDCCQFAILPTPDLVLNDTRDARDTEDKEDQRKVQDLRTSDREKTG